MTQSPSPAVIPAVTRPGEPCPFTPGQRVTRSLLGYGVLAGPLYVLASLAEAATRPGFDLTRHPWSLLALGRLGWIHVTVFTVTGLAVLACAVGLHRTGRPDPSDPRTDDDPDAADGGAGAHRAAWLLAGYGTCLVAAGAFRPDPVPGFPPGTPDTSHLSWHGLLHLAAGGLGFACAVAAALVLARTDAARGRRAWAALSRTAAGALAVAFVATAATAGARAAVLALAVAVILDWAWLTAVALDRYRAVRPLPAPTP